eukprot:329750-Prymnesium_polylepis.1
MSNSSLVPHEPLAQIDKEPSQKSVPLASGPPIEGEGRQQKGAGSKSKEPEAKLVYVALVNDDPVNQPIITAEDITTTVDIDFNAVQLDISIERIATMPDRWRENNREQVIVWSMRLPET